MEKKEKNLITPIYLKTSEDMPWPEDDIFYLLSRDGLFLCRNHSLYRSSVEARGWPGELAGHNKFVMAQYPKVPQHILELAVGFFARIGQAQGAEAAVLLAWDEPEKKMRILVPRQLASVYEGWNGYQHPIGIHYTVPVELPRGWSILGDIHSHVDGAAYSSLTDKQDENYRPGLHIVVGRIFEEPPQFHVETTVDGVRFPLEQNLVFEGYKRRQYTVPDSWFDRVVIEVEIASQNNNWKKGGERSVIYKKVFENGDEDYGKGKWEYDSSNEWRKAND
jgi:hypothetical protein